MKRSHQDLKSVNIYKPSSQMEIDLEEELNIEVYQVTLNIDIENINKVENIHNRH